MSKQRRCKEKLSNWRRQLRDINIYPDGQRKDKDQILAGFISSLGVSNLSIEGGGNPQGCNDQHNNAGFEFSCNQERNTGADPTMTTERRKRLAKQRNAGAGFPGGCSLGLGLYGFFFLLKGRKKLTPEPLGSGNEKGKYSPPVMTSAVLISTRVSSATLRPMPMAIKLGTAGINPHQHAG